MFWWAVALSRTPEEWKVASEIRWLLRMVWARVARVDGAAVASAAKPGVAGPMRLDATVATSSSDAKRRCMTFLWPRARANVPTPRVRSAVAELTRGRGVMTIGARLELAWPRGG